MSNTTEVAASTSKETELLTTTAGTCMRFGETVLWPSHISISPVLLLHLLPLELWVHLTLWTMVGTAFCFFIAGVWMCRVAQTKHLWFWVPIGSVILGGCVGFFQGAISAALIAAIYMSVPYYVGVDGAAGLGVGQAIIITYFQLGRGDFIHR